MRSPIFSVFCLVSAIGLAGLTFFVLLFSGWGDGSGGNAISGTGGLPYYLPSVYLLSLFICSFRFIKDSVLEKAAVIVNGLLALSVIVLLATGPFGIVIALLLGGFAFGARRVLFKKPTSQSC